MSEDAPRRLTRRMPSKRTAPERCELCDRRYGRHGPIRFKAKWICSRCLLAEDRASDATLNGLTRSE